MKKDIGLIQLVLGSFKKFSVAKSDLNDKMTWAEASGWVLDANSETTGNSGPANTGCSVYQGKDGSDPKGSWRLPIVRELSIIYSLKGQLELTTEFIPFSSNYYWSATDALNQASWFINYGSVHTNMMNFGGNINYPILKSEKFNVRCIKDL
jgi:hypothetical protein